MRSPSRSLLVPACILIVFFGGCQSNQQQPPAQDQSATQAQPGDKAKASERKRKRDEGAKQAASTTPAQPPQPTVQTYTVPAGAAVAIRLADTLDTGKTTSGTQFGGTLSSALMVSGVEVAPAGSAVTGQVTNVVSSGRLNRPAAISLVLTSITPTGGAPVSISTAPLTSAGASHKKRDAVAIGGGAGVGALIGGIAGKGKGAGIGALVGGAAGTVGAAATGKKEIQLAPETPLSFTLSQPANFTVTVSH